jgi:hypothetical protein
VYLKSQWDDQVAAQTIAMPQTSQKAGTKAIQAIMTLVQLGHSYKREKGNLDRKITAGHFSDPLDLEDAIAARDEITAKISANQADVDMRKKNLGIENTRSLKLLLADKYLQLRVNAQALKSRIRSKLQARKFELERIDKAARNAGSGELKLQNHIQSQVNRHQPGISRNVARYNEIVAEMVTLIAAGKAPQGSICPKPLDKSTLYSLDVDASIWDDAGLEEVDGVAPAWLSDEAVRTAIPAHLEAMRCQEEEARLSRELLHLQQWVHRQFKALQLLISVTVCPDWTYQLTNLLSHFSEVVRTWAVDLVNIPLPCGGMPDWRVPTTISNLATGLEEPEPNSDDELLDADEWEDGQYVEDVLDLVDMLEPSSHLAEVPDMNDLAGIFSVQANLHDRTRSCSPRKRGRRMLEEDTLDL